MINNKFVVQGQIVDTNDNANPYSQTATLTIILNGVSKSYPINNDGSFSVSLEPKDGINSVELIVANKEGKFDSGEFTFEYHNFNKDITDVDNIVKETNDTIISNSVDNNFAISSVITSLEINGTKVNRGDTFVTDKNEVNISFGINQTSNINATINYIDPSGNMVPVKGNSYQLELLAGYNPVSFVALDDKGVVVDSFDFVINSTSNTQNAVSNVVLPLTVTDSKGSDVTFDLLYLTDINGKPGDVYKAMKKSPLTYLFEIAINAMTHFFRSTKFFL
jgi:hypothetical protein